MSKSIAVATCALFFSLASAAGAAGPQYGSKTSSAKTWSISADYIEACSCHLFCACYFNTEPEGGEFCEFNNAVLITKGHVGGTKLDGKKVWLSGDLGGDFTKGMKSAVITFEPGTTKEQREAIKYLMGKVYPVKWEAFAEDEAPIVWQKKGMNGYAKLGNGKGEINLTPTKGENGKPTVIRNLKYWGAQKNTGFYLAYGTHSYKGNGHDYSYKDRNGFFIHIESSGKMGE